jgi:adenosylhomocysteine nucleosidase
MSKPDAQQLAPPPAPADVGIVMALPIEAGYLLDSMTRVRRYSARAHSIVEGELAGKLLAIIVSGPGETAARLGAELLIAGHRPRTVISAGFAGALDPGLARNALVLPHEVCDLHGQRLEVEGLTSPPPGINRASGRLLTIDRVITGQSEKADLRALHHADLIDMETMAIALLSRERSFRFLSVRIISDTAAEELPPEVARLLSHSGTYRVGVAIRAIWQRPSALKDFWALHARALESADRLARCLTRILEVLPA